MASSSAICIYSINLVSLAGVNHGTLVIISIQIPQKTFSFLCVMYKIDWNKKTLFFKGKYKFGSIYSYCVTGFIHYKEFKCPAIRFLKSVMACHKYIYQFVHYTKFDRPRFSFTQCRAVFLVRDDCKENVCTASGISINIWMCEIHSVCFAAAKRFLKIKSWYID